MSTLGLDRKSDPNEYTKKFHTEAELIMRGMAMMKDAAKA